MLRAGEELNTKNGVESRFPPDHQRMPIPSSVERIEAQNRRSQLIAFCLLTIAVIAVLLVLHALFANVLGHPTEAIILLLGFAITATVAEWLWLLICYGRDGIRAETAGLVTTISNIFIFGLAATLAILTDRDAEPYFVLLAIPILQCAFRFGLLATCTTIAFSVAMIFGWAQHFYTLHPPARPTEFLEAGMISVIYCLMGILVWYLVSQLRQKQKRIDRYLGELHAARQKLSAEEKLAAVGRLASGIAHEIRNPVAMIASSLTTARDSITGIADREDMFAIAAREARRLELLTVDFLTYARPSPPQFVSFPLSDIVAHVASIARIRATERSIEVRCEDLGDIHVDLDPSKIESALVNLAFNAIDATPDGGFVIFRCQIEREVVTIEVENSGTAITDSNLDSIFEPFFTTKANGTGLGLAIARSVARAHRGEVSVSKNLDGAVAFSLSLPRKAEAEEY